MAMTPQELADLQAHQQLSQQGSVMAKSPTPQFAPGNPIIDPLIQTIGQLLQGLNPVDWMGGAGGAEAAAGLARRAVPKVMGVRPSATPVNINMDELRKALGGGGVLPAARGAQRAAPAATAAMPTMSMPARGSGKVFKPAPEAAAAGYEDQLLKTLQSYLDPAELQKAKARMLPALQIGEGSPSAANLMIGTQAGGHGPLYEALQSMPNAQMTHGYTDPMTNTFFNDALSTMLYDPSLTQRAVGMLEKGGTTVNDLVKALGFSAP